jgi:pimeloyl-ACP methyl ester carboxylesterase
MARPPAPESSTHQLVIERGDVRLPALLHRTGKRRRNQLAIFLHGNPGGPIADPSPLASAMTARGIDVLRFNYRGLWGNPGAFSLSNAIGDLRAVLDVVTSPAARDGVGLDPVNIHLVGYSLGTNVALVGAGDDHRVAGIASLGTSDHAYYADQWLGPASPVRGWLEEVVEHLFKADGPIPGGEAAFMDDLLANVETFRLTTNPAPLLRRRLLFIHGLDDTDCTAEHHLFPLYRELRRLGHPRLEAELLPMDHGLGGIDSAMVYGRIADWIAAPARS